MKLVIIAASSLGLWSTLSVADIYFGVGAGKTWTDSSFCKSNNEDVCDDDNRSVNFFSGYELDKIISFEMGYNYLGDFSDGDSSINKAQSLTIAPKLSLPITDDISVYGKVGGVWFNSSEGDDLSYLGGVGFEFNTTENLSFRLAYQRYFDIDRHPVKNSMNVAMLGVSYKIRTMRKDNEHSSHYMPETTEPVHIDVVEKVVHNFSPKNYIGEFGFDSFKIEGLDHIIEELISILNTYPQSEVIIMGYTDSIGTVQYNLQLSKKRAQALSDMLIDRGISESRIITKGMGESNPIASNSTIEGRQKNRRVEIKIPTFEY